MNTTYNGDGPSGSNWFDLDQSIDVQYSARPVNTTARDSVATLKVVGNDVYGNFLIRIVGVARRCLPNDKVRIKRVHAIAQPGTAPNQHYLKDGSFMQYVEWQAGMLINPNGSSVLWGSPPTNENGSDPLNSAIVSWYTPAPFSREQNISINLRP